MSKNKNSNGPGRPKYQPVYPRSSKWTFDDFCEANGIDVETKKGGKCTPLTLRKFMAADKAKKGHSEIVKLKDEFGKSKSESGLGKPPYLFQLRSKFTGFVAPAAPPKKTAKGKSKSKDSVTVATVTATPVDATSQETKDYEAKKAALLAPTPEPVVATPEPVVANPEPAPVQSPTLTPVVTITPVTPPVETAPAPAPETAPVTVTETTPVTA